MQLLCWRLSPRYVLTAHEMLRTLTAPSTCACSAALRPGGFIGLETNGWGQERQVEGATPPPLLLHAWPCDALLLSGTVQSSQWGERFAAGSAGLVYSPPMCPPAATTRSETNGVGPQFSMTPPPPPRPQARVFSLSLILALPPRAELLVAEYGFEDARVVPDQFGVDRFVTARRRRD